MIDTKQHPIYEHLTIYRDGRIFSAKTNRFLTGHVTAYGYRVVGVAKRAKKVHRLVAETFYPESEFYGLDINHIDGVKLHNNAENLEWCTRSHNIKHAIELGLNPSQGETHPHAVYSEKLVRDLCQHMAEGWRNKDLVTKFNVNKDWLSLIRTGRLWTHVTKEYNIAFKRRDRISVETAHIICELLSSGLSAPQITKANPTFMKGTVNRIKRREIFKEISSEYTFDSSSRVTTSLVHDVCKLLQENVRVIDIVEELSLTRFVVGKIKNRKTWTNISKHYTF